MGAGAVAPVGIQATSLAHLIDPRRKWYNNRRWVPFVAVVLPPAHSHVDRLIALHAWIALLSVSGNPRVSYHFSDIVISPTVSLPRPPMATTVV